MEVNWLALLSTQQSCASPFCIPEDGLPGRQAYGGSDPHDPLGGLGAALFAGGIELGYHRSGPRTDGWGRGGQSPLQAHLLIQALCIPEQGVLPEVFCAESAKAVLSEKKTGQFRAA